LKKRHVLNDTILMNYKSDLPEKLQPLLNHPGEAGGRLLEVGIIQATLTQEVGLDDVTQQRDGRDEPSVQGEQQCCTGKSVLFGMSCCANDYFVYFLPYVHGNGQKSVFNVAARMWYLGERLMIERNLN